MQRIARNFSEHLAVIAEVERSCSDAIGRIGSLMVEVLERGGAIYWCGNGGSAADSQHLAAELVGRYRGDRRPLRSAALSTDSSVLTCIANDYGFEDIFARQVEALGQPGDVLVGITTSGNSENVLRAFEAGKRAQMHCVGLLGKDGGKALELLDHAVVIPSETTARIQEAHILIGHCLCELIEEGLGLA